MKKFAIVLFILLALSPVAMAYEVTEGVTPVYRAYNPRTGGHYLSTASGDMFRLQDQGWTIERVTWYSIVGSQPVYELYNPSIDEHLYTINAQEAAQLQSSGWILLYGQAFWSDGTMPIYRLYSPSAMRHLYTADLNEYITLPHYGWNQEGIAFYGLPEEEAIPYLP